MKRSMILVAVALVIIAISVRYGIAEDWAKYHNVSDGYYEYLPSSIERLKSKGIVSVRYLGTNEGHDSLKLRMKCDVIFDCDAMTYRTNNEIYIIANEAKKSLRPESPPQDVITSPGMKALAGIVCKQ